MKSIRLALLVMSGIFLGCEKPQTSSDLHIVGGRNVATGSVAARSTVGLQDNSGDIFCTGTLIAPNLVVSAAHCIDNKRVAQVKIFFGRGLSGENAKVIELSEMGTYKAEGAKFFPSFDIAWLRLANNAPDTHVPIEILRNPSRLRNASEVILAGYGQTASSCINCSGRLLEVETIFSRIIDNHRFFSLLVFGPTLDRGACHGDSGGPAYAKIDGKWYLVGATAGFTAVINPAAFQSSRYCESGESIYTSVADYVDWLEGFADQNLMHDAASNPAPDSRRSFQPLDTEAESWHDWVYYDNHHNPAWYTVDRLLEDLVFTHFRENRYEAYVNPSLTLEHLESLKSLELNGLIFSLAQLDFRDRQIASVAPFSALQHTTQLRILNQKIKDFSPLAKMPNLKSLVIFNNVDHANRQQPVDYDGSFLSQLKLEKLEIDRRNGGKIDLSKVEWHQLDSLQSLRIQGMGDFADHLVGINSIEQLQDLNLSGNQLSHVDFAKGARGIREMDLSYNRIVDLSGLDDLDSLEVLKLSNNDSLELAKLPLYRLRNLRKLSIDSSNLQDISSLANLENLEELYLNNNQIQEIEVLASLPKIRHIELNNNRITDFQIVSSLGSLKYFSALKNPGSGSETCPEEAVCNFPIPTPTSLTAACELTFKLRSQGTESYWDDYRLMQRLFDVIGLNFRDSNVHTCPVAVARLNALRELDLSNGMVTATTNRLQSIQLLSLLTRLEGIDLRNNRIQEVTALAELPNLKKLNLSDNGLEKLPDISNFARLEELHLGANPLRNLNGLSSVSLKILDLSTPLFSGSHQMMSLEGIEGLPSLSNLTIEGRTLESLGPLAEALSLRRLSLANNGLQDLEGIWELDDLDYLSSRGNPLQSFACKLKRIDGSCWFDYRLVRSGMEVSGSHQVWIGPDESLPGITLPLISGWRHFAPGTNKVFTSN